MQVCLAQRAMRLPRTRVTRTAQHSTFLSPGLTIRSPGSSRVVSASADAQPTNASAAAPLSATNGPEPAAEAPVTTSAAPPAEKANANENFTGDMLKPSVFNTPFARAIGILGAVAATAFGSQFVSARLSAFLHVSAYGVWLGTVLWNTFFVGLTMFKSMPRQMFGKVQSKLFPQYFSLTTGANLLALVTVVMAGATATAEGMRAVVALGIALVSGLVNWLWLEPKCTGLMFERYDLENKGEQKTDADKERIAVLYKEFGKWHGISSLVNLIIFMVAASHGWFLAGIMTLSV